MNTLFKILAFATIVVIAGSCRKIIQIDLNNADPKLVVDANISDEFGHDSIVLTKTVNFDESNAFPFAIGAVVILSDNAGQTDTLKESAPGIYKPVSFHGVAGRICFLHIKYNGNEYTSVSTIMQPVSLDSLNLSDAPSGMGGFGGGGGGGGGPFGKQQKRLIGYFHDTNGLGNYYRFRAYKNHHEITRMTMFEDRLQDGQDVSVRLGGNDNFNPNDTIVVDIYAIDKAAYDFFYTLNINSRNEGMMSGTPANPITNITGGALGYFCAYSKKTKMLVIK